MAQSLAKKLISYKDKIQKIFSFKGPMNMVFFFGIITAVILIVYLGLPATSPLFQTQTPNCLTNTSALSQAELSQICDSSKLEIGNITSSVSSGLTNYFKVPIKYKSGSVGLYDFGIVIFDGSNRIASCGSICMATNPSNVFSVTKPLCPGQNNTFSFTATSPGQVNISNVYLVNVLATCLGQPFSTERVY